MRCASGWRLKARSTLRFQCSPYYVNSAFYPSIDNFERALKFGRDETAESKLDKLEALIVTHYGRPLADVRFIAAMLSIPCEERYGALAMTPQKHKDETLRTLVDLTEAAASKQPTVMLYEDAHWADPTSSGSARPADRPGQNHPAADRAHPSARVPVALVRARPCDGVEPVQAHARAKQRDRVQAHQRQSTARRPARADPGQDRRRAAVCGRTHQVHSRIRRTQRRRRSLRLRRRRPHASPFRPRCGTR